MACIAKKDFLAIHGYLEKTAMIYCLIIDYDQQNLFRKGKINLNFSFLITLLKTSPLIWLG